tara:strand:+ start:142 stop:1455 length:1314 start_codon:yes stop_codon:yes gene_type:complete
MKLLRKKLVGGHNKLLYFLFLFFIILNKPVLSSQILDYETEEFLRYLIDEIKIVNNIEKDIKFKIISNKNINAFVDENNIIHITSGLIEHSEDYVALISVLAHEIGHIDLNHILSRKKKINKISNFKKISNLSIIAGSMISGNPELLQTLAVGSAGSSNIFIEFSKEQETEADIYSINTMKKLELNSYSIIRLLETIKKKSVERGLTENMQRISSHPYFDDRINLINHLRENDDYSFEIKANNMFKFIRAKFLGYSENKIIIQSLEKPYIDYSKSITKARSGDLKNSLKNINSLIKLFPNNYYLIETKADILFSYGFTNESIEFYKLIFKREPKNVYAQIRIFTNTKIDDLSKEEINELFKNNLVLLNKYYNNKNLLKKFLEIAEINKKVEWINFINFWINSHLIRHENLEENLNVYKITNDKDLSHLINIIYNNYL